MSVGPRALGQSRRDGRQLLERPRRKKRGRRSTEMLSKVVDEIDKAGLGNLSLDGPAAEDAALVVAAQNGNGHAFEILVGRHEQRIFFVARRITRTREDAEDVVQQSFQKAFTHLRKFEGRSAFSTWLTRIAITEALMFLRRGRGLRGVLIGALSGNEETTSALEVPDSR